ncbi:hypothetical protein NOF04DRAFT_1340869 [Fusarium oxysporum II5]|nr:hypothetical protein NOF04DRAFT_1340869 [Fusarium oxysporum II5]
MSSSSSQSSLDLETPRTDSTDRIPRSLKFLNSTKRGSTKDRISDHEIMHHYTSAAYRTFGSWEGAVAGINWALAAGVTSGNCHALYASSVFLLICAFATYPCCEIYHPAYEPLDGPIGMFRLAHGISLISRSSDQNLLKGPLQGLFAGESAPTAPSEHIRFLVDQLLDLRRQLSEPSADSAGAGTDLVLEATDLLADCLLSVHQNCSFSAPAEVRAALPWPLRMPDGFLALIQQREPLAMVLLAHYCVLFRYAETTCWFIKGWATTLMTIIWGNISGSPCENMIHWPYYLINNFSVAS